MTTLLVAVLVFPDVELLDFAGPLEVFTVARDADEQPLFGTTVVAPEAGPFRTRHGLLITPDQTIDQVVAGPRPDVLVVPGGFGVRALLDDASTLGFIRKLADAGTLVTSVCTGAWVLAKAGLLDGRAATTHHLCLDRLRELAPTAAVTVDRRVVDTGPIVTSGGISAGIDMALHVVERLHGREAARRTAQYMEYVQHVPSTESMPGSAAATR